MVKDASYELAMPFVVVTSVGGPYEDDAYSAGWEASSIDYALVGRAPLTMSTRRLNREQIDLIAMRNDYAVTFEPYDDEWDTASFRWTGDS